jgi:hypothetical protein
MFEQERVIGRLQRRVAAEPSLLACFLSGSYGRRAADDYSDIDVALVYPNEDSRDRAWNQRREFAQSVMPYVPVKSFDATHVRPYLYVTLFANGSKIDYRYESASTLSPGPLDSQIRILRDTDSWAEKYQTSCSGLSFPQPTISDAELGAIDQRFWVMFWDVLRLLARGDTDKPFPVYLQLLWSTLPDLLRVLPGTEPAHQGLINAYYSKDAKATAGQLTVLLEAYLAARSAVRRRYHLQSLGDQAFENELLRLIQRLV